MVVGASIDVRKQERARRKCMIHLLHALFELGVSHVWAERRTPSLNQRDLQLINALRSQHAIPDKLHVDFTHPDQEPMLWLPDIVAGAIGLHHRGDDAMPYERLRAGVTEHVIRLD
ncbi:MULTISPECIES: hypothetical protein [unclassified Microbacterium]|nr:hypothetical protein [Microbacterium sp. JB110]